MLYELLRKSVLYYAIQGKLSEQKSNEENINKSIDLEDVPFQIPENWVWKKLGEISNYGTNTTKNGDKIPFDSWVLDLEDIEKNTGVILQKKYQRDVKSLSSKNEFKKGDLLYGKLRPYLCKCVLADEDGYCSTEIVPMSFINGIYYEYIQIVLLSPYYVNYTNSKSYGAKMPRLGTTDAKNSLIPIPPYEEQKRIVYKVKMLLNILNEIKPIEEEISLLKISFSKDIKKSILSHYINGTKGDIKKLYEVTIWDTKFKGTDKIKQPRVISFKHVTAKELKNIKCESGDIKLLSTGLFDGFTNKQKAGDNISEGEVITFPTGGTSNIKYFNGKFVDSGNNIAISLDPSKYNLKYIYYSLLCRKDEIESLYRGVGIKHPDMPKILELDMNIPSIDEQNEIVNKIELVLPLCDDIDKLVNE